MVLMFELSRRYLKPLVKSGFLHGKEQADLNRFSGPRPCDNLVLAQVREIKRGASRVVSPTLLRTLPFG